MHYSMSIFQFFEYVEILDFTTLSRAKLSQDGHLERVSQDSMTLYPRLSL